MSTETPELEYTFKDFASANTPESFMQDQEMNANLRDNGVGLVPNMAGIDIQDLSGTFACGCIWAYLTIPMGWHIFEDGQRTLVFNEENTVQINFDLHDRGEFSDEQMIEQVIAQVAEAYPEAKWITMELAGMKTVGFRGIPIEDVYVDQIFMVMDRPERENAAMLIRITCDPEATVRTMNMVEVMLRSLQVIQ